MPLFGAHMSIAGGLHKAAEAAAALGCATVQLFTKNASQWAGKPLTDDEVRAFRTAVRTARSCKYPTAHDSYLINLASPDDALYRKSIDAFVDEVERAEALGLSYLVTHPGAHVGSGEEAGLARVVAGAGRGPRALRRVQGEGAARNDRRAGDDPRPPVRAPRRASSTRCRTPDRLGVCFDTCHVFAAGYAARHRRRSTPPRSSEFDRRDRARSSLKLFHVNDSVKPLGSRVDRHAGIGLGADRRWRRSAGSSPTRGSRDRPMILETPKEDADGERDGPGEPRHAARVRWPTRRPRRGSPAVKRAEVRRYRSRRLIRTRDRHLRHAPLKPPAAAGR